VLQLPLLSARWGAGEESEEKDGGDKGKKK
jgi:hypothetical protein